MNGKVALAAGENVPPNVRLTVPPLTRVRPAPEKFAPVSNACVPTKKSMKVPADVMNAPLLVPSLNLSVPVSTRVVPEIVEAA